MRAQPASNGMDTKKLLIILIFSLLVLVSIFSLERLNAIGEMHDKLQYAISQCGENKEIYVTVDCWYELMRQEMRHGGIQGAFAVFTALYETSETFIKTGCHRHAHRIGDMAYYEVYLTHKDMKQVEFPQAIKYCGYGFLHGFLEHLISDNPDPAFVEETCANLEERLGDTMPAIRISCFHASGHGFMLAPVDKNKWGDPQVLIDKPLQKCDSMSGTSEEIEECREGAFNVLLVWMYNKEYGLVYDADDPFLICRTQLDRHKMACYYEMAQELGSVSEWNIIKVAQTAENLEDGSFTEMVMRVAVASMMQQGIARDGGEFDYLLSCRSIPQHLQSACIGAIAGALIEHGKPGKEYVKGLKFCSSDTLLHDERQACYKALFSHLGRFYTHEKLVTLCNTLPPSHQMLCFPND